MKNFIYYPIVCFTVSMYLLSCAPKAQESVRKNPKVPTIGSNDVNLIKLFKKPFADFQYTEKNLAKNTSDLKSDSFYLMKIGNIVGDEIAVDTARMLHKQSEQIATPSLLPMAESQYLVLIEQQSSAALSSGLSETEHAVLTDTEKINLIIDQNDDAAVLVTETMELQQQLSIAEEMIQNILAQIQNAELFPELKTQVLAELSKQTSEQLQPPINLATELSQLKTLSEAIAVLNSYVTQNQTVLTPEDETDLKNATQLGALIDKIHDPESAMAALAMAWSMLDAEERKLNFRTANKDLYDFLRKKDEKDIRCLVHESCKGIIKKLILKVGVYPAIKDYGVGNVQKTLNESSLLSVKTVVQKQSALQISTLGTQIKEKIKISITEKLTSLHEFKRQFKFIIGKGIAERISANELPLFENNNFEHMFKTAFNQAENLSGKNFVTQFALIEKMLQFMKRGTPLTSAPQSEDIKTVLKAAEPRFYIQSNYNENGDSLMRAKDQSWALMFYAKMIQQLADWKTTSYDSGITKFVAQDFVQEFQSEELKQQLFPKAELVGMALSLAAQTLKQMQTEKSPIYLLDKDNNRISIKQYLDENYDSTDAIVVHAAVSDLKNGTLVDSAKLSDICLMIEALNLFYLSTEGIEKSQSESLKDPALLTELLTARKQIRLVIMVLANFISNQLIDKEINLYSEMNFQTDDKLAATFSSDYTKAIDALLTAYDMTGIEIYKLAALEIYYSLNRKFYSAPLKFYRESNVKTQNAVDRTHVLEMLSSLIKIRQHLGITSQLQFDRIFENWYASILL